MTQPAAISTTLSLVRHFAGSVSPCSIAPQTDWEQVVAFASAQLVLPALYPAIERVGLPVPDDAHTFLLRIHAANAARNLQMGNALLSIGSALNSEGIEPVLLKGAALLASDPSSLVPWRFLSDLDLLVPAWALPKAVAALQDLGYEARDGDYVLARDAHYPALIAPGGSFAVELHTRMFAERAMPALEAQLPAHAQAIVRDGVRLRLPTAAHRIAHLIAHAQLQHAHYANYRLLLRGFLELSAMLGPQPAESLIATALELFETSAARRAATAYLAASERLMRPGFGIGAIGAADRNWADSAIARIGQPARTRALSAVLRIAGHQIGHSLRNPDVLIRNFRLLLSPAGLTARLARHRTRLRQTYWA